MKTSDFDYTLPPELIAQTPIEPRSQSRLMVVNRKSGTVEHRRFFEIADYLQAGDVLVFNNSRVIPARLRGRRPESGGTLEILLLRQLGPNLWETLVKRARSLGKGAVIEITGAASMGNEPECKVVALVVGSGEDGSRILEFSDDRLLPALGEIPLPPYIHTPLQDAGRYQTVYAEVSGSVAAPTAGLHFTHELLDTIKSKGIRCLFTTLHIGLDTFRPVHEDDPREHKIHREYGELSQRVADELSQARLESRRIICVGTTSARLVEAAAQANGPQQIEPLRGWVDLFIVPGHRFRAVDAIITNFHLPKSTLLMLVSAFAGKDLVERAYQEAIAAEYRFYSFGDAMLIL